MHRDRDTSRSTRRQFLAAGAKAGLVSVLGLRTRLAEASPLGLPLGLQLYAVREMLAKDYAGTLKAIGGLGFREVEAAGFQGHSAQQVSEAMQAAGLSLVSAHYSASDLHETFDETLAFCEALHLQALVCSFPAIRDPSRLKNLSYQTQVQSLTLDDFRWNADQFNLWGRKAKAAGLRFGYHNYTMEFVPQQGVVPYDELLRLTDPELVNFEMDCGWVSVGGGDPVQYLQRFPGRISMLHVKDFKPASQPVTMVDPPPPAELGRGTVDFRRLFQAAKGSNVRHIFVEQEGFDMPPLESLKIDVDYMRQLVV